MSERRIGIKHEPVGVDDWEIGLLMVDDATGIFHASLDSPSRRKQLEIWGKNYPALLKQARHIAGLHVGLVEVIEGWHL